MGLSTDSRQSGQNCHIVAESAQNGSPSYRATLLRLILALYDTFAPYAYEGKNRYPGKYKLWQAAAPGYSLPAILHWKRGYRSPPPEVIRHWCAILQADIDVRQRLLTELEAAALEREAARQAKGERFRRMVQKRRRAKAP